MDMLISVRIPANRQLPGNRPGHFRKVVDWPTLPRTGDMIHVGNLFTKIDNVLFRNDGRPEVHVDSLPELSDGVTPEQFYKELDSFCDELIMAGFTAMTGWDRPEDEFSGPNG